MKLKHISNIGTMGGVQTYLCGIKNYSNIKKIIKQKIVSNSKNIIKLEKIIASVVR